MSPFDSILAAINTVNKATGAPQVETTAPASGNIPVSTPPPAAPAPIDALALLEQKAKQSTEKGLDYKKSIVDLLKLLDLDSSLSARRELADDLGYAGDKGDSAKMNVWLIKEVIERLGKNGGSITPPGSSTAV